MKKQKKRKSHTLGIIQAICPWVETVSDADKPIVVKVTQGDVNAAEVKSHSTCAMAIACRRKFHADAVLIQVTVAYIVNGIKAIRYKLGPSIGREIVVFDRKGPFKAGEYQLSVPSPSNRLGLVRAYDPIRRSKNGGGSPKRFTHYTEDIRTALSRLPAERMLKTELDKMKTRLKG